jgi:hypothetical protein
LPNSEPARKNLTGHGNGADNSLTGGVDMLGSLSCLWPDCAYLSAY